MGTRWLQELLHIISSDLIHFINLVTEKHLNNNQSICKIIPLDALNYAILLVICL